MLKTPVKFPGHSEWCLMLTTVAAYFDESGNFKDHDVISIGCVAGYAERFEGHFAEEWSLLLHRYGLKLLTAKEALNHKRPLSQRNPCLGVENRSAALLSFIACIRKHLQAITGLAVDAKAFKKMPSHLFEVYGNDPVFFTFVRAAMHTTEFTPDRDKVAMICDDSEATALTFYRLYRRVKKVWPDARRKFAGISFVDDRYLYGLQASDLVASILKYEATEKINGTPYDYKRLYSALIAHPNENENYLFNISSAVATEENLQALAEDALRQIEKKRKEDEEEQRRVRELRQDNAKANSGSTQRHKSQTGRGKARKTKA